LSVYILHLKLIYYSNSQVPNPWVLDTSWRQCVLLWSIVSDL